MSKSENYQCLTSIDCEQGAIRAVRYNVDGNYCLTCGTDRRLKLWNPHKRIILKTYCGHGNEVLDACSSGDSSFIASCSADKTVIYWDVTTGQPLRRYRAHAAPVTCVKFNEESSVAISGSQDNCVHVWDVRSRQQEPIQSLKDAKDCITAIKVDRHKLIVSSVDCCVRVYDIRMGAFTSDFLGDAVISTDITKDSQCVLASLSNETILLIDIDTGEMLAEFKGHKLNDYRIEAGVNSTDTQILSGSCDGAVVVWDLVTANVVERVVLNKIENRVNVVSSMTVHPKLDEFIVSSHKNIHVWTREPIDGVGDGE